MNIILILSLVLLIIFILSGLSCYVSSSSKKDKDGFSNDETEEISLGI